VIYGLLRWIAGVALRWYYRDVQVRGIERLPRTGPLLVAPNHPNALVDALLVGRIIPRRLLITAKATLFANPIAAWALRKLGVLPLRRMSDERRRIQGGGAASTTRNEDTFRAVLDALAAGGAVLMFPEGKSWDEPYLAPLRTGIARIALQAQEGGVSGVTIVPVGIVFEQKERPRSRVLVQVGEPIDVEAWSREPHANAVAALTDELTRRLHAVTLNHPSLETAVRERDLAALFAALREEATPLTASRPLEADVALARRIAEGRLLLESLGDALDGGSTSARVNAVLQRADAFVATLATRGLRVEDVTVSPRTLPGARFALREGAFLGIGLPIAVWGRVHHWLPMRLAGLLARGGTSRADPAMRRIVAGVVLVLAWYAIVWFLVRALTGSALGATAYLLTLPIAEDFALRFQERMSRAYERMRAYLTFRRDPALHRTLRAERAWLRDASLELEEELLGSRGSTS